VKLSLFLKVIASTSITLLSEGALARDCQIQKKTELTLSYTHGLATVEAKINHSVVTLGVDTGAQTLVTPDTVKALKLGQDWRRTRITGTTAVTIANHVLLRDFEIAGDHIGSKSVAQISLPQPKVPDQNAKSTPIAGLIGMDILADYDLDFDFPHRKLTLYDVRGCAQITPPDFKDFASIRFTFNQQRSILLAVEVDGKKLTAILDTGAMIHSITGAGLKKVSVTDAMLKADPVAEAVGVGNVTAKRPLHRFNTLTIGGVLFHNVSFGVLATSFGQGEILLGQQYLFTRRFWVSSATRTLFVENRRLPFSVQSAASPSLFPPPMAGQSLAAKRAAVEPFQFFEQMSVAVKAASGPATFSKHVFGYGFPRAGASSVSQDCGKVIGTTPGCRSQLPANLAAGVLTQAGVSAVLPVFISTTT
jgi:predicted aspartyl protease